MSASRGAEVIAAREAGRGIGDRTREAGVSYDTLRKFLVLNDVPLRGRPGKRWVWPDLPSTG